MNAFLLKIKNTYKNEGAPVVLRKIFAFPFKFAWHHIKAQKRWIFGKLFELIKNNRLTYKGVILSFDNNYFQTKDKGNLLFHSPFEENQILFAEKYLKRNLPLIELGGCTGVVACVTDKMINNKHIVVEANPYIIPVLEKNKQVNKSNFVILNKALGYKDNIDYYVSTNPVDGGLYKKTPKKISIQGTRLESLAKDFEQINLIVDIEGSEVDLIDNEIDVISKKVAVLIIEFHPIITGETEVKRLVSKLEKYGLQCVNKKVNDSIFINSNMS